MTSRQKVYTNPFAIPSRAPQTPTPLTNQQKAAESLATFIKFGNPTLSKSARPLTSPPKAPQSCFIDTNGYSYSADYTPKTKTKKRPLHALVDGAIYDPIPKRRKRQKYPNDGGLTDAQYERILEARRLESEADIAEYLAQRKRRYPTATNVARKRSLIDVKVRRGQKLSITERIQKHGDDSGHKKTPSVLRFLRTPRFDPELVRRVLHKEIDAEHSAVLQCFRFILKTNFLTEQIDVEAQVEQAVGDE